MPNIKELNNIDSNFEWEGDLLVKRDVANDSVITVKNGKITILGNVGNNVKIRQYNTINDITSFPKIIEIDKFLIPLMLENIKNGSIITCNGQTITILDENEIQLISDKCQLIAQENSIKIEKCHHMGSSFESKFGENNKTRISSKNLTEQNTHNLIKIHGNIGNNVLIRSDISIYMLSNSRNSLIICTKGCVTGKNIGNESLIIAKLTINVEDIGDSSTLISGGKINAGNIGNNCQIESTESLNSQNIGNNSIINSSSDIKCKNIGNRCIIKSFDSISFQNSGRSSNIESGEDISCNIIGENSKITALGNIDSDNIKDKCLVKCENLNCQLIGDITFKPNVTHANKVLNNRESSKSQFNHI